MFFRGKHNKNRSLRAILAGVAVLAVVSVFSVAFVKAYGETSIISNAFSESTKFNDPVLEPAAEEETVESEQQVAPVQEEVSDPVVEEELVAESYVEEETYYQEEPQHVYAGSSDSSYSANSFKRDGVVYGSDGTRYTWYSQNVLPGGGLTALNNNGRYVDDDGYIRDGDGYIAAASSDYAQGTIVETPFGTAKIYDSGCASGTIDIYTNF